MTKFINPEKINLLKSPITETVIQQLIAEDPSRLGLGNLVLKDTERRQPHAGRLDLLLQDADTNRRYEVEIQLGKTDETHIIRTLEYWDVERKRYPQYDHCAVIIAEDITSRFLNVVSLFNGHIPLIAIKMEAYRYSSDEVSLIFTTVLDELTLGLIDEDEEVKEVTDRNYWINRGTSTTVKMADELLGFINDFADGVELKYNKFYIGLAKDRQPFNFAVFRPRKSGIQVDIKLPLTDDIQRELDASGLDDMGYDKKYGNYRLKLDKNDLHEKKPFIQALLKQAYENFR
jgi:hypothetical protein